MKYSNGMLAGRKISKLKMDKMIKLFKENVSNVAIAERLNITHTTICKYKKKWKEKKDERPLSRP